MAKGNYYGFFGFNPQGQPIIKTVRGGNRTAIMLLESRGYNKAYYEQLLTVQYVRQIQVNNPIRKVDQQRLDQLPQLQQAIAQPQPQYPLALPLQPLPQLQPPVQQQPQQQSQLQQFTQQSLPTVTVYVYYVDALFRAKVTNYNHNTNSMVFLDGTNYNQVIDQRLGWWFSQYPPLVLNNSYNYVIRHILDFVRPVMIKRFKEYFSNNLELIADDYYNFSCLINGKKFRFGYPKPAIRTFLIP